MNNHEEITALLLVHVSGPEVKKLFFILKSAEQEIYPAHKC